VNINSTDHECVFSCVVTMRNTSNLYEFIKLSLLAPGLLNVEIHAAHNMK
jgi:hypothetical protein